MRTLEILFILVVIFIIMILVYCYQPTKPTYQDSVDFISLTYQKVLYDNPSDLGLYLIGQNEPTKGESFKIRPIQNTSNVYQVPKYQLDKPGNVQYLFVIRLQLDDIESSVKIVHPDIRNSGYTIRDIQQLVGDKEHLHIIKALQKSFLQNSTPYTVYSSQYFYKGMLKNVVCQNYFRDSTTPYNSPTNNNQVYIFCSGYN